MKKKIAILLILASVRTYGWDHSQNPDQRASVGIDFSAGKIPGMMKDFRGIPVAVPQTDGGFVKGAIDIRVPITNALTIHTFGSSTGINNNLQFSEGHEVGAGFRVYIGD